MASLMPFMAIFWQTPECPCVADRRSDEPSNVLLFMTMRLV
jgi:hypothetical protein